ncbi:MAG: 50S ribosomal protein L10 [Myxococcaceae bacterium]|nr:50S ribosomal protein L10 [Myxococcaceae bacterium]MBH2006499.1 50S ribosomal protein L10 [Myxococcaceae bacterium]
MERTEKEEQIEFLKSVFGSAESIVLTSVQGLDAAQVSTLRRQLHDAGVGFKVIKNKLARIAADSTPVKALFEDFANSTAIAWSDTDAVAPAKVLVKYQEACAKFEIKAGLNAGVRLDLAKVKAFAALPGLEELRAQLLGVINGVPAKLLAQINAPASHVVGVIQAKLDKDKE